MLLGDSNSGFPDVVNDALGDGSNLRLSLFSRLLSSAQIVVVWEQKLQYSIITYISSGALLPLPYFDGVIII